jgi:ABC-type transport system involved in multi-copper enzyme maturation permease subunit
MAKLLAIVNYTIKQHVRNRIYLAVLLFGLAIVGGSLVVSSLAMDERLRVLLNLGLAGIEFISVLSIVFVTVGLILDEVESKSVYLILSHPIERWQYVIGRFVGTFFAVVAGMVFMACLHIGSLKLHGWDWQNFYLLAWFCSVGKVALISSLALFISLITTSTASSMTLTSFLWVMGHFSAELKFLGEKSANVLVKTAVQLFYHIAPDFSVFNYRDFYKATPAPGPDWFAWLMFYLVFYVGTMLYLSSWLFAKREY